MQVEYVLHAALTLQTDSALPHVVMINELWMHWMHSTVGLKAPQVVSAHAVEQ
jgi:hypothetical protein